MKLYPDFSYEEKYWQDNYAVIGIDEVGRGCLAGPITVGGVCIDSQIDKNEWLNLRINDSKKLSALQRNIISDVLITKCVYATASTSSSKINETGIVNALKETITKVVQQMVLKLQNKRIILLIDGLPIQHIPYINDIPRVSIVKGDGKSISIASASVIAKVERDLYMCNLGKKYPEYYWDENKGYGTQKHRDAIKMYGPTPLHRSLFIRNITKY